MDDRLGIIIDGQDSDGQNKTLAIQASINGVDTRLPTISPNCNELERASKRKIPINSPLVTYNDRVDSLDVFRETFENNRLGYREFTKSHPSKIPNYSFNLRSKERLGKDVVEKIRLVQIYSESPFLFEYEANHEQDVSSLRRQLDEARLWLEKRKSSKILVPVIDMRMYKEGLFLAKLESLSKYKRINVVYGLPSETSDNWSDLKAFLQGNNIWCHMDCIPVRYNRHYIAHRVRLYACGISSTSLGCKFGGGGSSPPKLQQFNSDTHRYVVTPLPSGQTPTRDQDVNWITSLNTELAELQNMRDHTISHTLYARYIPSKDDDYLRFTERV